MQRVMDMHSATETPAPIRREDYRPPDWHVTTLRLDVTLDPARTVVRARMAVTRNGGHDRPLVLDHGGQRLVSLRVDGAAADPAMDAVTLTIPLSAEGHVVETEVEIAPETNTQLMGLYASGGLLCTQCEAEGFRRITPFPDRPDVLARYTVRMEADRARFPVLLANGNRIGAGLLDDGRHWAEWEDPFPKPSYLFAMVAGDLQANVDRFTTMSGRDVELAIWVKAADLPRTEHAMASLKAAMAWDERVYGREYDLDLFNIVAVDDFNFGAMENKSLNIFNSRYVLADPETATDADYDAIAAVVAHEYFHNWSGNRVTCRDWFQLSLKEGFTVFRDQGFSADQGSPAVKRIEDVRALRASQFPEDAGPLAHPVRPESYIEIGNFYTATVYNKGAEVIQMMHALLGAERFRRGTDLYFARHDGEAATCEDFVRAMEDGGAADLGQFRLWYTQAGTPRVMASLARTPEGTRMRLAQHVPPTPGQPDKAPMAIPLKVRLFGAASGQPLGDERLVLLDAAEQEIDLGGFDDRVVLSINRGFCAPVIVETDRSPAELAFLSRHDDDPFARYEAMQQLMLDTLTERVSTGQANHDPVVAAVRDTIEDMTLDRAFVGEAVLLPSESFIGDRMLVVDPDAIHSAREALRHDIGTALADHWRAAANDGRRLPFTLEPAAKARRRLRGIALGYLAASDPREGAELAFSVFGEADNMTDRMAGLVTLANLDADERVAALDIFYNRYGNEALVLDKWFSTQALSIRPGTLDEVIALTHHRDFTRANPNRARALIGAFGVNQLRFHSADGRGYAWYSEQLLKLDKINPQTAAKLLPPLGRWRRLDEGRGKLMHAALSLIVATPGVSKDLMEQATKSLE